jgi:hypothetical protein
MYVANQNFYHAGQLVKRGDKIDTADNKLIASGLIREAKITQPVEVKSDAVVKPSTKRTRKSNKPE